MDQENKARRQPGGHIALDGVSLRQGEDGPWLLHCAALSIEPGQSVAVAGGSGEEASALLRLLGGVLRPQSGAVRCDGQDLYAPEGEEAREHIAAVLGEDRLFFGDIFSNIALKARGLTLEQAWDAARLVGLAPEIEDMPMGIHTLVGEHLGGMTAGQRQRLLLARAVAARPRVLLLDEHLLEPDALTQRAVVALMAESPCTRVVATHNARTMRACARVLVLGEGGVLADGGFDDLEARGALAGAPARLAD